MDTLLLFWGEAGERERHDIIHFAYYDQMYCDVKARSEFQMFPRCMLYVVYFACLLFAIFEVCVNQITFSHSYVSYPILGERNATDTDRQHREMTWSHRTNTLLLLEKIVYSNAKIDFIEFDILFCEKRGVPVIGHSDATASNITLSAFLMHFVELVDFYYRETIGRLTTGKQLNTALKLRG